MLKINVIFLIYTIYVSDDLPIPSEVGKQKWENLTMAIVDKK